MSSSIPRRALVVGATGIVGQNLGARLVAAGWEVHGLSRSGRAPGPGIRPMQADLADPAGLAAALDGLAPELVAITAWTRQATEAENIAVNGAAVRDLLAALEPAGSVRHVALMTGLKHYLGPFEAYAQGQMGDTPFHEDEPRLDAPNFYYAQEDELFAAAARAGFTWSVHRSHTVFGFAVGNAMNMVLTLSAYAAICRKTGRPFVFPGSETQWNSVTDVTDADLLADQIIWAATSEAGQDQAFNTANGDVFRWRWLWPQIAEHFGLEWEGFSERIRPLTESMAGTEPVWAEIAAEHGLVEPDLGRIASWWHTDSDLGREIEVLTDMNKSRKAGFTESRDSRDSFFGYVERYRAARIVP
ncbi:SDR family oxidoreductase [Modestobacter muralis]|uniref:SDR family oxidoreductase n=1 Tax=Modestobacter muralis TaxID=1608614 RepID=A0A6P0EXQ2_9ACTN|nr:SDR family oxidoreductase [Modestobacter muralis]NEK95359.1 SDR family oxidoreductase [Modestobacter muralis]NEN52247.1 SDR family oxidoreductase [Modestobacter muralis]